MARIITGKWQLSLQFGDIKDLLRTKYTLAMITPGAIIWHVVSLVGSQGSQATGLPYQQFGIPVAYDNFCEMLLNE